MKDIELIEKVQKTATKQVKQIKNLPYSEWLARLQSPSLLVQSWSPTPKAVHLLFSADAYTLLK